MGWKGNSCVTHAPQSVNKHKLSEIVRNQSHMFLPLLFISYSASQVGYQDLFKNSRGKGEKGELEQNIWWSAVTAQDACILSKHADTDCELPMDNEETPEEDGEAADQFQAWMNEIADQSNELEDYSPFPSKIFALLYSLVHGPHPVVSS